MEATLRGLVLLAMLAAPSAGGCGGTDADADADLDADTDSDGDSDSDSDGDADEDGDAEGDDGGADGDADADGGTETRVIPAGRRVVWEGNVGVPGGIPSRASVCATIDAASYGDGRTDATAAIQAALDGCGDDEVVLLPAGTYRVTGRLNVPSHRVLRGAGPGTTTVSYQGPAGGRSAIAMAGWPPFSSDSAAVAVLSGADKGSRSITVADASEAEVGSLMLVDRLNDGELVDAQGVQAWCGHCGREDGNRTSGQIVQVTAVEGDRVSFDPPLYWTHDAALSPEAIFAPSRTLVRWSGVEDLTLTQPEPSVTYLVEMQGTQSCWLRNVEVERVHWRAVWMLHAFRCEVRDSYFHESLSGYGRSHGYGVLIDMFSSANLIENNVLRTLDGGFLMAGGGASGNVLAYNYMEDSRFDDPWWLTSSPSVNHAPHPMMNLWEGNVGYQIAADFIWGSSSHATVYRSVSRGWQQESITANNNAVAFATGNTFMNVVGCVLGTEGRSTRYEVLPGEAYDNREVVIWSLGVMHGVDGPEVAETLLRHGNWDPVSRETVWDPAIEERSLPASLYLSSRPEWFGEALWPPIGPDVTGLATPIPAQLRFEAMAGR